MKKKNAQKRLSAHRSCKKLNKQQPNDAKPMPKTILPPQISTSFQETRTTKDEIEQIKQKIKRKYERHEDMPQKKRHQTMLTVNIKSDMPPVETALDRLMDAIKEARTYAVRIIKLIHGYGSTGKGGKICVASRKKLEALKKAHQIKDYIPGENFTIYNPVVRQLMDFIPALKAEPDLENYNNGISFVIL